jgi:hypothetical protein
MTITLSSCDTALMSSVMFCALQWLQCHCYTKWEPELTDLLSEIPFVADTAALSASPVVAGVVCLDAVQLRRTAVVR